MSCALLNKGRIRYTSKIYFILNVGKIPLKKIDSSKICVPIPKNKISNNQYRSQTKRESKIDL